jgi:hypothetical protein
MDIGGELFAASTNNPPGSHADTFDMVRKVIDGRGRIVNWPAVSWTHITPGFNGTNWGRIDHWYWNKP